MKAIRRLGFIKIMNDSFCMDYIQQLNTENLNIDCKPWSFLTHYFECGSLYKGMGDIVTHEKLVTNDTKSKRVFKNLWLNIWKDFGDALSLDASMVTLLSEFGIRLAFIEPDDKVISSVTHFYDTVIRWYLYTSDSFRGDSIEDVLNVLINGSIEELVHYDMD